MKIACVSLVAVENKFVAIEGRKGLMLPGGKQEYYETYKDCAARELREETGLVAEKQKLIFHAPSDDHYVFTFETTVCNYYPRDSIEGTVTLVTWEQLLQSKFRSYLELLKEIYESKRIIHG